MIFDIQKIKNIKEDGGTIIYMSTYKFNETSVSFFDKTINDAS